jgi:hypothetical protein
MGYGHGFPVFPFCLTHLIVAKECCFVVKACDFVVKTFVNCLFLPGVFTLTPCGQRIFSHAALSIR